ncbi:plasma membrane fusion protein prm1 [Coemansia sp. RSA 2703]|nr:plasma membrane fusion protein prm1 [Coemansia sp. RSA 2703]KAJ2371637.1 plasma membrane fusion protein prm1 [Coemansia sp. RSA 2607]KAJ2394274.1 plasma membrane fusion protein prm1 [Coemansia sp. RSA 2603]
MSKGKGLGNLDDDFYNDHNYDTESEWDRYSTINPDARFNPFADQDYEKMPSLPTKSTWDDEKSTYPAEKEKYPAEKVSYPVEKEKYPVEKDNYTAEKSLYPAEKSTYPAEKVTYPAEKITYPAEKSTYPAEKSTYPAEKVTYPAEKSTYPAEKSTYPAEKITYPTEKSSYPAEKSTYPNEKYSYPSEKDNYASSSKPYPATIPVKYDPPAPYSEKADDLYYPDYDNDMIASPVKSTHKKSRSKEKGKDKGKGKAKARAPAPVVAPIDDVDESELLYSRISDKRDKPREDSYYNTKPPVAAAATMVAPVAVAPAAPKNYSNNFNYYEDKDFNVSQYSYQEKPSNYEKRNNPRDDPPGPLEIQPYVGKWAKISRAWATQTVILLIFMGYGYVLLAGDARDKAKQAVSSLNSGCLAVQTATEAVVNSPRTAAHTSLEMVQTATIGLINVAFGTLNKILSMLESLIMIVLKIYVGTFICIAEVIIRTALTIVADVGEIITGLLNTAIDSVLGSLQSVAATVADGAQNVINGIVGGLTGGQNTNAVNFNTDEIRQTLNVTIPTDWVESISGLQDKIPTEEQIFGNITQLLDIPFNMLRGLITTGFSSIHVDFADSVKLPDEKNLTICDHPIGEDTINGVGDAASKVFIIGGLAIIGFAFILVLFQIYMVVRRNRRQETRMIEFRQDLADYKPPVNNSKDTIAETPPTRAEMDLYVLPGNRVLDRFVAWQRKRWGDSPKALAYRWWFDYAFYPPAIACFIAGAIGLISVMVQTNAINDMRAEFTPRLARDFDAFQQQVIGDQLLGSVRNDSIDLANNINGGIYNQEYTLNHTMFAPVDEGTSYLNNTLNDFISMYIGGIRSVFGGTVLEYPVEGFVNCTLTKNIQTLQKIITFVDEYLGGVDLPRVSEDVLYNPALKLLKPVNKTVDALRKITIGTFVPNATMLDPEWFPSDDDLESSREEYQDSLESAEEASEASKESMEKMLESLEDESEESEESMDDLDLDESTSVRMSSETTESSPMALARRDGTDVSDTSVMSMDSSMSMIMATDSSISMNMATDSSMSMNMATDSSISINMATDTSATMDMTTDSSVSMNTAAVTGTSASASSGLQSNTDVVNIKTVDSLPELTALLSSLSESPLSSSLPSSIHTPTPSRTVIETGPELGNLEEELSSIGYDIDQLPTLLSKEDVETAQKFNGYTGGLVGELCDYYVGNLQSQIPTYIALMCVWIFIIALGGIKFLRDMQTIKRHNLK